MNTKSYAGGRKDREMRSLSRDLTISLGVAVATAFLIATLSSYWLLSHRSKALHEQKLEEYIHYLRESLNTPIWNKNDEMVERICRSFTKNEAVALLRVTCQNGATPFEEEKETKFDLVKKRASLVYANQVIGHVELGLTPRVYRESNQRLLMMSVFTMLVVVAGLVLAAKVVVRKFLQGPLDLLIHRIRDIAAGVYEESGPPSGSREFAAILEEFNCMAERVEEREQTLVRINRRLEDQIAERVRAEAALRESEERYRTLFERSSDAIFLVEKRSGKYLAANRAAERLTGRSLSDLMELTTRDVTPEGAGERLVNTSSADVVRDLGEVIYQRSDGAERIALLQSIPLNEQIVFGMVRDITEQRQLEKQFFHAQKMEAIGQLAGGVAHDFNNLIQVIQGYSEMAREESEAGGSIRDALGEVLKASARGTILVRQLMAFSRKQMLHLEELHMDEVVAELAKMIQRVIGEHIDFDVLSDQDLVSVYADKGQIEQILMNLCVNARDAMPNGGALSIETSTVELDEAFCEPAARAKPGRYVRVSVADTGRGMDEETRRRIFEPFFTTKGLGEGTGLGLSTVFGIVRQHNGMVHVQSDVGVGSIFEIYLPSAGEPEQAPQERKTAFSPGGAETILLADDDKMVRLVAEIMLRKAGYTVMTAGDGVEVMRRFDEDSDKIDLALLDVVMPKIGGKAVFDYMRAKRPRMRVLFVSAYKRSSLKGVFALDEDMQLIEKPYRRDILLRKVREALDE